MAAGAFLVWCQRLSVLAENDSDAGLFAYGGRLILSGYVPYRDFWDHKPPLVFYLNALGFALTPSSFAGPTLLHVGGLLISVALAFLVARQRPLSAGVTLIVLLTATLTNSAMVEGGFLTETYLVPFMTGAVALSLCTRSAGAMAAAGALLGLGALLRPSALACSPVLAVTCLTGEHRLQRLGMAAAGFMLPVSAAALYFASRGEGYDLWMASVGFNLGGYTDYGMAYTRGSWASFSGLARADFGFLPVWGVVAVGLVPAFAYRNITHASLMAWLALESIATTMTGRAWGHYFLPVGVALAFAASSTIANLTRGRLRWLGASLAFICIVSALPALNRTRHAVRHKQPLALAGADALASRIEAWTRPDEPVLTWGYYTAHLVRTARPSFPPLVNSEVLRSRWGAERWAGAYCGPLPRVVIDAYASLPVGDSEGSSAPPGPSEASAGFCLAQALRRDYREEVVPGFHGRVWVRGL